MRNRKDEKSKGRKRKKDIRKRKQEDRELNRDKWK